MCAGLVILTAFLDFDRIMEVIGVFTPMIVIAIIVLVIYSLVTPHPSMAELNATATQVTPALPNLWFSTINYFALCGRQRYRHGLRAWRLGAAHW